MTDSASIDTILELVGRIGNVYTLAGNALPFGCGNMPKASPEGMPAAYALAAAQPPLGVAPRSEPPNICPWLHRASPKTGRT